jgi:formylglycine-generating enzyme required for sulfatase activity
MQIKKFYFQSEPGNFLKDHRFFNGLPSRSESGEEPLTIPGCHRSPIPKWSLCMGMALLLAACSSPAATKPPVPSSTLPDSTSASTATAFAPVQTIPENTPLPASTLQPTPTATEQLAAGSTRTSEIDHMVQVYVPAGDFTMGSNGPDAKKSLAGGRAYPEVPVNTVYLDGYWIDKFEVTNGQYALCVDAGDCQAPHLFTSGYGSSYRPKYYGNPEYSNYPVIWVNWSMALAYCQWAGRKLPSEAEWEKAARGTDARTYPWGNDPLDSTRANFCDIHCPLPQANGGFNDGYPNTAPAGSFPAGASPYGVMDMAGNVWEWTSTLVRPYPYTAADGREDPKESPNVDGERVWRGGSWTNGYWWMRASLRYRSKSWYWNYNLGFRCAAVK